MHLHAHMAVCPWHWSATREGELYGFGVSREGGEGDAERWREEAVEAQAIMCSQFLADVGLVNGCRHDLQESASEKRKKTEHVQTSKNPEKFTLLGCGTDLSHLGCVCGSVCLCQC